MQYTLSGWDILSEPVNLVQRKFHNLARRKGRRMEGKEERWQRRRNEGNE